MTTQAMPDHKNGIPTHYQDSSTDIPLPAYSQSSEAAMKKYNLIYTTSRFNVRVILDGSKDCTYYVRSNLSFTKPQLELRRGNSKTSPMVAFAKYRNTSRHTLLGLGDCQKSQVDYDKLGEDGTKEDIVYEELRRESNLLRCSDYLFGTNTSADGKNVGRRREFRWRKDMDKLAKTVFDCVEVEDGVETVVGRMLSGGAFNWNKGGEVLLKEGLDEQLEDWLMLSALAVWGFEALTYQSIFQGYENESKTKRA